jgi:hypothetical protein
MGFNRVSASHKGGTFLSRLCFLFLLPVFLASAQESNSDDSDAAQGPVPGDALVADSETDAEETIDEVIVVGPRTLVTIKRQMERADKVLFEIANTLIDDPLYKVYCRRETSAGTNIRRRVCRAGFENELMFEAWEEELAMGRVGENRYTFNYDLPESEMRRYRETQQQKMIELAVENPELAAAIYRRAQLQRDYDNERRRRRQEDD